MKRVIIIVVLIGIGLGLGIGYYLYSKKVPTLASVEADFKVSANDLTLAFEDDEAAATKKYDGKVIEVKGKVLKIINDSTDSNIILEADMAMMGGVNCSFKYRQDKELNKGDDVVIKGRCQGYLMDVIINNCILID